MTSDPPPPGYLLSLRAAVEAYYLCLSYPPVRLSIPETLRFEKQLENARAAQFRAICAIDVSVAHDIRRLDNARFQSQAELEHYWTWLLERLGIDLQRDDSVARVQETLFLGSSEEIS